MNQINQFGHPTFAIPRGWVPVFCAPCHPCMHPGAHQHMPFPMSQGPICRADDGPSGGGFPMSVAKPGYTTYGLEILESPDDLFG